MKILFVTKDENVLSLNVEDTANSQDLSNILGNVSQKLKSNLIANEEITDVGNTTIYS